MINTTTVRNMNLEHLGFTKEQVSDIQIIMSLTTESALQEWMEAVGLDDVEYGIQLMDTVGKILKICRERDEDPDTFSPASIILDKYFS